jgi:hypothetical protein
MKPLDDPKYLWQNSFYFQQIQEQSKMPVKQKSKVCINSVIVLLKIDLK